jgi:dihydrofolate reductase
MRRVRYSVAASLDGFIADPDGGYDWIIMDPAIDFAEEFAAFDTFVMGRKTFEVTAAGEFMRMLDDKEVIVFTRTLTSTPHPHVTLLDGSRAPGEVVRSLKGRPGKDISIFGGADMFRQVLDAGVVDTVEVGLMPVLLGQGIPLVAPGPQVRGMKLVSSRILASGIVLLTYALPGPS